MHRCSASVCFGRVVSLPWRSLPSGSDFAPPPRALFFDWRGPKLAKPRDLIRVWKIQKGDEVFVRSGKEKGKVGTVLQTDRRRNMVKVSGCNLRRVKHPETGEDVMIEKKIHYSNVNLLDPVSSKPTRIALKYTESGEMVRVSKASGSIIPLPDRTPSFKKREPIEGPKDTPPEIALERTFNYESDLAAMKLLRQTMRKYNYDFH